MKDKTVQSYYVLNIQLHQKNMLHSKKGIKIFKQIRKQWVKELSNIVNTDMYRDTTISLRNQNYVLAGIVS